jgi:hypothetical protein
MATLFGQLPTAAASAAIVGGRCLAKWTVQNELPDKFIYCRVERQRQTVE